MRSRILWIVALVGCLLAATVGVLGLAAQGQGKGGGKGGKTISVTVTFRDTFLSDRIMSDCQTGSCPYIDKVDKVNTGIGTSGDFSLKLTKGNQPPIRTLFLDFSDCASGPCNPPFLQGFTVGPANVFTSGVSLRDLDPDETTGNLRLRVAINLTSVDGGLWNLLFDPFNAECPGSSSVTVKRVGDADAWEIEAGPTQVACLGELAGGGELIVRGRYHMPFKIMLQKK